MSEPELIGNPIEHKFASGAIYTFQELSLRKQAHLTAYIRDRRVRAGLEALGGASPDERVSAMRMLMKPLEPEEMQAELNSLPITLYALYIASDAEGQGTDFEAFADSLGNAGVPELVELIRIVNGVPPAPIVNEEEDAESVPNSPKDTTANIES